YWLERRDSGGRFHRRRRQRRRADHGHRFCAAPICARRRCSSCGYGHHTNDTVDEIACEWSTCRQHGSHTGRAESEISIVQPKFAFGRETTPEVLTYLTTPGFPPKFGIVSA